jgi:hypothetical protein
MRTVVKEFDQKNAFASRLKRINSGQQYEHEDVVGFRTQKRFDKRLARRPKTRRTFADKVMVLIAFLSGIAAVFGGRFLYFHMAQLDGMPEAFIDLGGRGMALFAFTLAGILTVIFHLATRARMQALVVGCALMHFGEAAVAAHAPELWGRLFSPDYVAGMSEQMAGFRLTPAAG